MKELKKGTLAARMLNLLEAHHPVGVPVGLLAKILYEKDSYENRARVRNLARTLRAWGFRVYGFGGAYRLCTQPRELLLVFERSIKLTQGQAVSTDGVALGIGELGDPGLAAEAKRQLRQMLLGLASGL